MRGIYSDWQMERDFEFFFQEFYYTSDVLMPEAHFHNYLEISAVSDGEIVYDFGTRKICAGDGDVVVVNHIEPHAVSGTDKPARVTVLGFRPELVWKGADETDYRYIENFFDKEERFENLVPAGAPYCARIRELIGEIVAESKRKEDGYKLMIKAKLLELLTLLYRYHPRIAPEERGNVLGRLKPVLDYLYQNADKPLRLADCAAVAGYSPSYFSALFRRFCGKRFCDCLTLVRVEKCCELLCGTDLPVREIGKRCGLPNSANFLTLFRRLKGMTPLQYRKKYGHTDAAAEIEIIH